MKYLFCVAILALIVGRAAGQQITIMGKITDEKKNPVANVHVIVDGQLGECTSDNSGLYRLTLQNSVPVGQPIKLRIEDGRFNLFTFNTIAATDIHDIALTHKDKLGVVKHPKDTASGECKAAAPITLQNPTFNGPTQIGNGNTQFNNYSYNTRVPLDDSVRKRIFYRLLAIRVRNPEAPTMKLWTRNGDATTSQVKDDLFELLHSAELNVVTSDNDYMVVKTREGPMTISTQAVDTPYINKILRALEPYMIVKPTWSFRTDSVRWINLFLQEVPSFSEKGCVGFK